MELLGEDVSDSVTLFSVQLSEGELVLYLDCLNYLLNCASDKVVSSQTECSSLEELSWYRDDILELIKGMRQKDFLPDRYKGLK